jgi:hypothetical protein
MKAKGNIKKLLRIDVNRRRISDALSHAVAGTGSATVVVKDTDDKDVTLRLQRRPALTR